MNSNLSDIATALTQSLATTGVSSMSGQFRAATGSAIAPGIAFASDLNTGFYLAGTDQIGLAVGGVLSVTFNSDLSVTFAGDANFAGGATFGATTSVTGDLRVTGNIIVSGTATNTIGGAQSIVDIANGGAIVSTASVNIDRYIDIQEVGSIPGSAPADTLRLYITERVINSGAAIPVAKDENGTAYPLAPLANQCRLAKSGTKLVLSPYAGNLLSINGVPQSIDDAGISLAASNSAGVFVYIYAFMTGAQMTLEMSTTAPSIQAGTGIPQKLGDSSRSLVGAAFTDTGGAWADTDGKLWTLSYYNRVPKASRTTITASLNAVVSAGTYVEVDASMRNQFISWSDEPIFLDSKVQWQFNNVTAAAMQTQNNVDGGGGDSAIGPYIPNQALTTMNINHSKVAPGSLTEAAVHYASPFIKSFGATVSLICSLGASSGEATAIYVQIRG
jgi:hypothetical protein